MELWVLDPSEYILSFLPIMNSTSMEIEANSAR
jgi:hypothetical protein